MKIIRMLAVMVALLTGGAALSHGGGHVATPSYDYSKAEEMPFGKAADPAKAGRTVKVAMGDTMRFTPARITVKRGETVRFDVKNDGKLMHEMVLGTRADLEAHAQMMRKHPGMEHDEPYMLHVPPGKSGRMGWRFDKPGEFLYGCLVPGHFEAGMVGTIIVTEK
jgi:uncharacterized cupredoxin-like copper-binding protein